MCLQIMQGLNVALLCLLVLLPTQISTVHVNFYWREYTGVIPKDAVIVGQEISGENVYVGQAYVKNEGLVPVPIYQGVKEVVAVIKGPKKIDKYIKILCGPQEKFKWLLTKPKTFNLDVSGKITVIGGHDDRMKGKIYIARISYKGETKIGKVNQFRMPIFYFYDDGEEKQVEQPYEVLLYTPDEGDADEEISSDDRK